MKNTSSVVLVCKWWNLFLVHICQEKEIIQMSGQRARAKNSRTKRNFKQRGTWNLNLKLQIFGNINYNVFSNSFNNKRSCFRMLAVISLVLQFKSKSIHRCLDFLVLSLEGSVQLNAKYNTAENKFFSVSVKSQSVTIYIHHQGCHYGFRTPWTSLTLKYTKSAYIIKLSTLLFNKSCIV